MRIAYDGTRYSGWQIQPNSLSIQEVIEGALQKLLKTNIRIVGAGRTDAGVHAHGQSAHFWLANPSQRLSLHALNGMLPHDIRILEISPTSPSFHAQYSALTKVYHYHLWLERTIDPFCRLYRHHFHYRNFSLATLQESTTHFVGQHDFATFANSGGSLLAHTIRKLVRLDVVEQEGGVRLEFEGDGFLYKMVRNIVGTLLEVAIGKRPLESIPLLINARDRRAAGPAAPPKGLFLVQIHYPSHFDKGFKM